MCIIDDAQCGMAFTQNFNGNILYSLTSNTVKMLVFTQKWKALSQYGTLYSESAGFKTTSDTFFQCQSIIVVSIISNKPMTEQTVVSQIASNCLSGWFLARISCKVNRT